MKCGVKGFAKFQYINAELFLENEVFLQEQSPCKSEIVKKQGSQKPFYDP